MKEYTISIEDQPSKAEIRALIRNLVSYNNTQAEKENWRSLASFIRDDQSKMMGGLYGYTHWGWLFISHLWVIEALRRQGLAVDGSKRNRGTILNLTTPC